ncbi:hypothetical protein CEXT_712241 [Caerostris extrusa]|uniref:Uncharacterized protein n=1 Tax=Caerostris extrusa TaxID=172846 RepID=A0AAV4T201_CAEEX|nr:hypothetical protein CEXT_712241 [Caerostris extrusa]
MDGTIRILSAAFRLFHEIKGFPFSEQCPLPAKHVVGPEILLINKCFLDFKPGCLLPRFRQKQNNEATAPFGEFPVERVSNFYKKLPVTVRRENNGLITI